MKEFIKINLKLLSSNVTNQIKQIKRLKNEYWRKLSNQKIPKNPEIANATVYYLISKNKVKNQEDLDRLVEFSDYLKKFLYIKDFKELINNLREEFKSNYIETYLTAKDHQDIKIEEYIEKSIIDSYEPTDNLIDFELINKDTPKLLRRYGYDILINRFEPLLRKILINEVIILNYGLNNWINEIPKGIIQVLEEEEKEINLNTINIEDFFEELYLWALKEISIYKDHFKHLQILVNKLDKSKFIELMDDLNDIRKKIAHAKSTFSGIDFNNLIFIIKQICQGDIALNLIKFINNKSYKMAEEIPLTFFSEYKCPNNLPVQDYDLDGGFVGRKKEIETTKKLLYSDQDRIISITGAGGIGKTAEALKTSYIILADDNNNPFEAIIWFSAKESKLTAEYGIVPIESGIKCCEDLVKNSLGIVDIKSLEIFEKNEISYDIIKKHLYDIFSTHKCLLIIDNLETIKDEETINFIKDIPRPSQVLITSRRGLGEIERRYNLPDFNEKDAIKLFRIVSKERNRIDLLKLKEKDILNLVKKVRCYPLLIKWSIGKVCLGMDLRSAFCEIYSGTSEIAEFVFNDVFELLTDNSRSCLYSMIIYGERPITKPFLKHLANLDENEFDDAIRELIITSFVYPESSSTKEGIITTYTMLSLTRGFVQHKLDENTKQFNLIENRFYELSRQIQEFDKSLSSYHQSMVSLGIKTDNEKIAFKYVKSAKNFEKDENIEKARENYDDAIKIAPNFPYALMEYAKFEYKNGHYEKSEKLFLNAIKADPVSFHVYFSYGLFLKKQNRISLAIDNLKKAQQLNPDYLRIYNELGRCYTFNGEFENAQDQFEKSKKKEKYPNYKHQFITLQYQADNYKRWAEPFSLRKDYSGRLIKLFEALKIIQKANKIKEGDLRSQRLEKDICLQIAITYCVEGKFQEAVPYFERNFKKIKLKDGKLISYDEEMTKTFYYIAKYGFELKTLSFDKIYEYIKKGMTISHSSQWTNMFEKLKFKFDKESVIQSKDRKVGIVDWINIPKKYGIIKSNEDSYIFFKSGFFYYIDDIQFANLEGKEVSFALINDPKDDLKKIAGNILIESN